MANVLDGVRRKEALFEVLNKLEAEDCDPITEMAKMAMDINVDIDVRVKLLRDLAQYIHPKRRSVEISNKDGEALIVKIKRFDDADLANAKFKDEAKATEIVPNEPNTE